MDHKALDDYLRSAGGANDVDALQRIAHFWRLPGDRTAVRDRIRTGHGREVLVPRSDTGPATEWSTRSDQGVIPQDRPRALDARARGAMGTRVTCVRSSFPACSS